MIPVVNKKRDGEDGMLGPAARATAIPAISIGPLHPAEVQQRTKGQVLVVLSNAKELDLRDGRHIPQVSFSMNLSRLYVQS